MKENTERSQRGKGESLGQKSHRSLWNHENRPPKGRSSKLRRESVIGSNKRFGDGRAAETGDIGMETPRRGPKKEKKKDRLGQGSNRRRAVWESLPESTRGSKARSLYCKTRVGMQSARWVSISPSMNTGAQKELASIEGLISTTYKRAKN